MFQSSLIAEADEGPLELFDQAFFVAYKTSDMDDCEHISIEKDSLDLLRALSSYNLGLVSHLACLSISRHIPVDPDVMQKTLKLYDVATTLALSINLEGSTLQFKLTANFVLMAAFNNIAHVCTYYYAAYCEASSALTEMYSLLRGEVSKALDGQKKRECYGTFFVNSMMLTPIKNSATGRLAQVLHLEAPAA